MMSSSDQGCSDTMPDLVDPCPHHDRSSNEDSLDITIENKAKATHRSTRIPPTVLLPSYFEEDQDGNDDDGEVYDDEDETVFAYPPPFGTNRVTDVFVIFILASTILIFVISLLREDPLSTGILDMFFHKYCIMCLFF
jgi:hypothetical protein